MTNQPQMNRRERLRAQTFQEIEDSSFAIIDADGVHALSIAALARSMAMSAPAVYRYFPSRDALIAHLVTLSYQQLAIAMSQAAEGTRRAPRTRVRLLVAAYRDWALRTGGATERSSPSAPTALPVRHPSKPRSTTQWPCSSTCW